MTYNFPSGQNVTIFIDGVYIELSFRLDWKDSRPKVPIYGYNDHVYTRTIRGRTLVQGFLVTDFVVPNYLGVMLERNVRKKEIKESQEFDKFLDDLPIDVNKRAEAIGRAMFPYLDTKKILQDTSAAPGGLQDTLLSKAEVDAEKQRKGMIIRFTQGRGPVYIPDTTDPVEPADPVDLTIYYHDPEIAPWYVLLRDVEITDISQTISAAGAEGSSEPIYEVYEFVARKRELKVVSKVTSSRGKTK